MAFRCYVSIRASLATFIAVLTIASYSCLSAFAQPPIPTAQPANPVDSTVPAAPVDEKPANPLATDQGRVAEQFRRLEQLLLKSAELESANNPARAALLQQAAQLGKQAQLAELLARAAKSLEQRQYSQAIEDQKTSRESLKRLLELLQSENRQDRVREQRDEVRRWIEETDRLLRLQISQRGRTEGGQETKQAAKDQGKLADKAGDIAKDLKGNSKDEKKADLKDQEKNGSEQSRAQDTSQDKHSDKPQDSKPGDKSQDSPDEKKPSPQKPGDGKTEDSQPSKNAPSAQPPSDKSQQSQSEKSESQKSQSRKSESPKGHSQQGKSQPQQSQPGNDQQPQNQSPQPEQNQQPNQQQPSQQEQPPQEQSAQPSESQKKQPQDPSERAKQRLEKAQQKMKEAQQKLDEAQRKDAVEKQLEAEEQLRAAIEELEEILRQLREEEIERSLAALETRLRRMLEMQIKVLDDTKRLQEIAGEKANRQIEIRASNLSLEERKILSEGERAQLLLREEGSSVAFPEAISQVVSDIQSVVDRLAKADVGKLTVAIEQEIVSALEEMVEALAKVQKDQKDRKERQQQQQQQQPSGEQPLVDKLSEIRLIRTLQVRVNKRTNVLSEMLKDPNDPVGQAEANDLLQQVRELAQRQSSVQRVARDIEVGKAK